MPLEFINTINYNLIIALNILIISISISIININITIIIVITITLTLSMARVNLLFTKNITSEHLYVCALPKIDETIQTRIHIASDRKVTLRMVHDCGNLLDGSTRIQI